MRPRRPGEAEVPGYPMVQQTRLVIHLCKTFVVRKHLFGIASHKHLFYEQLLLCFVAKCFLLTLFSKILTQNIFKKPGCPIFQCSVVQSNAHGIWLMTAVWEKKQKVTLTRRVTAYNGWIDMDVKQKEMIAMFENVTFQELGISVNCFGDAYLLTIPSTSGQTCDGALQQKWPLDWSKKSKKSTNFDGAGEGFCWGADLKQ